jgi:MarR family transcriptional regulator for hemolysin
MSSTASLSSRQRQLMFVMAQVIKQWRRTLDKVLAPLV